MQVLSGFISYRSGDENHPQTHWLNDLMQTLSFPLLPLSLTPPPPPFSLGMYARPLANGTGILGLYFSTFDSLLFNQLDKHGLPDSLSSVLAGG